MKSIKVKYHDKELKPLEINPNGNWVDLRAAEDITMNVGEYRLISLGISMELPEGYEAITAPRSSTFKNFGIIMSNSIGIIDESYKGDDDIWYFPAYAVRKTVIHKNDRICQFRIIKHQPCLSFDIVEILDNENRGGVGSTGIS